MEVPRDEGNDRGHDQGRPDPLQERPTEEQHGEVRRQGRRERAGAVDHEPEHEGPFTADHRADLATGHHQHRHDQRVQDDGALDAGDRRVQVIGHGRDRHVHDRAVERHQELSGTQREQHDAGRPRGSLGGRVVRHVANSNRSIDGLGVMYAACDDVVVNRVVILTTLLLT
jgi:hypothetical protein